MSWLESDYISIMHINILEKININNIWIIVKNRKRNKVIKIDKYNFI